MTSARHKRVALPSRQLDPRRLSALAVLVGVAALGAVTGPVAGAEQDLDEGPPRSTAGAAMDGAEGLARGQAVTRVSRDQTRGEVVRAADDASTPAVVGPQAIPTSTPGFIQEDTTVVADPTSAGTVLADLDRSTQIALTGRTYRGFAEIVQDGALAWVLADDIGDTPPPEEIATSAGPVPAQVSESSCPGGGSVESGLRSNTVKTYRAVCAAFPGLVVGGVRPGDPGEHGTGEALDIMLDTSTGHRVAAYLQQNGAQLGVDNVIWRQRIWFVGDPFTQWKSMADRGSATQNHMDHVHVGTR